MDKKFTVSKKVIKNNTGKDVIHITFKAKSVDGPNLIKNKDIEQFIVALKRKGADTDSMKIVAQNKIQVYTLKSKYDKSVRYGDSDETADDYHTFDGYYYATFTINNFEK